MEKEWKEFDYGDKKYKISTSGELYNYDLDYFVKHTINQDGYPTVKIGSMEKRKSISVHKLVAIYFVNNPKPDEYNEINHIDFNRENCNADNLEWCTHKQNIAYSYNANRMYAQNHDISGENNNNYGNRKLSKIYKENPELAKEKQSRPGIKNGRCMKVAMFTIDKSFYKEFNYLRECADYIINSGITAFNRNVVAKNISDCIVKRKDSYLNYYFKTI